MDLSAYWLNIINKRIKSRYDFQNHEGKIKIKKLFAYEKVYEKENSRNETKDMNPVKKMIMLNFHLESEIL